MPRSAPSLRDVTKRARTVTNTFDGADTTLPKVDGPGCLGCALVRGGESRRLSAIPLAEIAERLATGNVSPEDGVGNGYIQLEGRRVVNVGVLPHGCLADLATRGFRLYAVDASPAYSLVVVVPPADRGPSS